MEGEVRLVSWNVQGSAGLDIDAAAGHLLDVGADVVALQEIQRRQTRRLAAALGWSWCWAWKHWPVRTWPEGAAVLGRRPILDHHRVVLHRTWPWSWRRRIALVTLVDTPAGPLSLIDVHLSSHDAATERQREVGRVGALVRHEQARHNGPAVVAGDLNDLPGAPALAGFVAAGLRDAWAEVHGAGPGGATNWSAGAPRAQRPPDQRLDYVLVPEDLEVRTATVPAPGDPGFAGLATLSDHLPLTVTVAPGPRRHTDR